VNLYILGCIESKKLRRLVPLKRIPVPEDREMGYSRGSIIRLREEQGVKSFQLFEKGIHIVSLLVVLKS